jgi:hypothetical protein
MFKKKESEKMLDFSKLTLDDINRIKPYFLYSGGKACDNTVGGTFIWRDYFATEYALFNDTLICKANHFEGQTAFSVPLGEDVSGSLKEIENYCRRADIPIVFCMAAKEDTEVLKSFFGADRTELRYEPNWSDYIYRAEDLINLPGRKFSGQRNHINYFKKTYPGYSFEKITENNAEELKEFYRASGLIGSKNTDVFIEEQNKVFEVLDNYAVYGLTGGLLRTDGKTIAAFAVGETAGNILYVHIEKADTRHRGAYQMIVNEFAKHYGANIDFINREDDAGDEGLRISKISYHPCEFVEKYTVTIK